MLISPQTNVTNSTTMKDHLKKTAQTRALTQEADAYLIMPDSEMTGCVMLSVMVRLALKKSTPLK